MNLLAPASAQIEALTEIETWLTLHEEERAKLNRAIFTISNAMGCHPHDLSMYILIRTASI